MWYAVLAENRGGTLLEFGRDPTFQHWMQKMIASCPSRIWDKKQNNGCTIHLGALQKWNTSALNCNAGKTALGLI
jgi:hypothetical protein